MGARARALVALAAAALAAGQAHPAAADDQIRPVDRKVHIPLTVGLGAAYALAEGPFKDPLSADVCRWCGPALFDASLRDGLVWDDTHLARSLSNVTGFWSAPIWALGGIGLAAHLDGRGLSHWLDDAIIIAESAAVASLLNFTIKASFARERPFVHYLPAADKPLTPFPQDNNQSFYSGHATLAMSLAVSAGTVARLRSYRHWRPLYAGGVALALATGYLRIAADKHWTTDVLTGWLLGAAFGHTIPTLLHRRTRFELAPIATRSTIGLAGRW